MLLVELAVLFGLVIGASAVTYTAALKNEDWRSGK